MTLRCAVYTRKSTEEGLKQDFNSLHAQREACEAYIKSQSSEGWKCLPNTYDDGGYSGGSMNRPGLQALLVDIDSGKVDIVVVYKVDRLTRSLMDFAQIVSKLDAKGVSFVSVTQSFNTTSSMGRLTLNVLLSFAQFEREVTAERIRDKIAASKKKGIWMGGPVPLGYDLKDRQLHINESEAQTINWLYDTYLKTKCVRILKAEADRLGLTSKRYTQQTGRTVGGHAFSRGQLYCLLKNPLYIGKIRHRDKIYQGQHKAIVDQEVWDHVQTLLAANGGACKAARNVPSHGWLSRLLLDSTGEPMVVTHAKKQGRIYRYYVSASFMTKKSNMSQGWRLPAKEVESIVLSAIKTFLSDPVKVLKVLGAENLTAGIITRTTVATKNLTENIDTVSPADMKTKVLPIINQVRVNLYEVAIVFNINALGDALGIDVNDDDAPRHHTITLPVQLKRRGVEMRIVLPGLEQDNSKRDGAIRKLIARAHVWFDQLKSGTSITDIAKANAMDIADVSRVLPLAFLAPDIVTNILNGTQPIDLTAEKLKRCRTIPHAWNEQRRALGFA